MKATFSAMYVAPGRGTVKLSDVPAWLLGNWHRKLKAKGLTVALERRMWDGTVIRVLEKR